MVRLLASAVLMSTAVMTAQKGDLYDENLVVTNVDFAVEFDDIRTNKDGEVTSSFSRAVSSVSHKDGDVYIVNTNGLVSKVREESTNVIGTVTFEVSLPRKLVEATKVSTNLVSSMTQSQKTRLLAAIVEYIRKKEGIAAPEVQ